MSKVDNQIKVTLHVK